MSALDLEDLQHFLLARTPALAARYEFLSFPDAAKGRAWLSTMVEKVGPFKVEFPTNIEVLEREEMTHIKAQASGADNKIGSRMKLDLDVNLREDGDKTVLAFVAGVDILGKLAALGHGIIKRKADQVLDEFAQAVKKQLEGDS